MSKAEFDGILKEDLDRFKDLLLSVYGIPWEDSYLHFTNEIRRRIRRKDINVKYRPAFEANLEDLVLSVVSRFIKINSKLHRAGKSIDHFYGMLEERIKHVYYEELRRLARLQPLPIGDGLELSSEPDSPDNKAEQDEQRAIRMECYKGCLEKLPPHILSLFLEYYDSEGLSPAERTRARQQLALQLANIPPSEATPEALKRAKGKIDAKMSKWRKGHLAPCMEKCLKRSFLVSNR